MKKYAKPIGLMVLIVVVVAGAYGLTRLLEKSYFNSENEEQSADTTTEEVEEAKDFMVYNADYEQVNLSDFRGTPVYLNFWASWCGVCTEEMPYIQEAYDEYGDQVIFLIVNITDGSRETVDSANEFLNENNYTFTCFYDVDLEATSTWGISGIPVHYFIDEDGYIQNYVRGGIGEQTLKNQLELLLNE